MIVQELKNSWEKVITFIRHLYKSGKISSIQILQILFLLNELIFLNRNYTLNSIL